MCLSPFLDSPTKYHRLIYKEYAFLTHDSGGWEVHGQVAECVGVLLLVGLSAEVQDGAGHCSEGQNIPTHILFPLKATVLSDEGLPYGLISL